MKPCLFVKKQEEEVAAVGGWSWKIQILRSYGTIPYLLSVSYIKYLSVGSRVASRSRSQKLSEVPLAAGLLCSNISLLDGSVLQTK